jgi:hypothetical protein
MNAIKQMGQSSQYNESLFCQHKQHTFSISNFIKKTINHDHMTKRNHEANSLHSSNNLKFVLNPRNAWCNVTKQKRLHFVSVPVGTKFHFHESLNIRINYVYRLTKKWRVLTFRIKKPQWTNFSNHKNTFLHHISRHLWPYGLKVHHSLLNVTVPGLQTIFLSLCLRIPVFNLHVRKILNLLSSNAAGLPSSFQNSGSLSTETNGSN